MTSAQQDAPEVHTISDKAFIDGLELLQLIEVMQGQNKELVSCQMQGLAMPAFSFGTPHYFASYSS